VDPDEEEQMRTRTRWLVAVGLGVAVLMGPAVPASASVRKYVGTTDQGERIVFVLRTTASGNRYVREIRVAYTVTCEDASTYRSTDGYGLSSKDGALVGREFSWKEGIFGWPASRRASVSGRFRPGTASGTLKESWAVLTSDDQAQLCTTGDLGWTASRV
jgi:hypothetical protein